MVGFGKPVIAGTAISTAIIASRFNARESITGLAEEYGCTPQQIEEAIRGEQRFIPFSPSPPGDFVIRVSGLRLPEGISFAANVAAGGIVR